MIYSEFVSCPCIPKNTLLAPSPDILNQTLEKPSFLQVIVE